MSYLIDPAGKWWRWPSLALAAKFGRDDADIDIPAYALRNLGYVWLINQPEASFLQFRAGMVSERQIAMLEPVLHEARPGRPVALVYFASGWTEEVHADPALLPGRLRQLAALREPRQRDLFIRHGHAVDDWRRHASPALARLYALWREQGGRLGARVQDFLRSSGLEQRTVLVGRPAERDALHVLRSGTDFTLYDSFIMDRLNGQPLAAQPDRAYGQWVIGAYEAVEQTGNPTLDDIDAIVEAPDHDPRRRRYQRLLLPWRDEDGAPRFTGTSLLKLDLAIPFDLAT
ncbi:MAG: hypothetical protein KA106_03640 [Ferrovibrio sp.]|nr:hypothetical protein [Ferrovibrio sp.]